MATNALTFRCPMCGTTVDVSEDMLNQSIICPNEKCQSPFELEIPHGEFIGSREVDENTEATPPPDRSLDERAIGEEKTLLVVHPSMFRRDPFWFAGYVLIGALGLYGSLKWWLADGSFGLSVVAFGAALAALGMLFSWWVAVLYTTLTVTSKRSILRTGIISRSTTEVRHDDVRNLQIHQGIFERLLNVGDIAISSAGQDELEIYVTGIPQPGQVAKLIRDLQE